MSIQNKCVTPLFNFSNLYELLDAMMLHGCAMIKADDAGHEYRMELSRCRNQWCVLYLGLITMETHGFAMGMRSTLGSMNQRGRLRFRSMNSRLFYPVIKKWYGEGKESMQAVTPGSLQLSQDQLAFWLCSTLLQNRSRVYLNSPKLNDEAAAHLAGQINALGIQCRIHQGPRLFLPTDGVEEARQWLKQHYAMGSNWWTVGGESCLPEKHERGKDD